MHNVLILGIAQFFGAFGQVTLVVLAGIIGAILAPDPKLATLPAASAVLGVAMATVPAALAMSRFGRRRVFTSGCLMASTGALCAAAAIAMGNFWMFCGSTVLVGANLAFTAQYRFAAAESVPPELVSRAVARVMLGTLAAAAIAPQLVIAARHLIGAEYVACFILLSFSYLAAAVTLGRLHDSGGNSNSIAGTARPLPEIARQPEFLLAVMAAAVGYGVMALIMTATPVSMHVNDGHSVEGTAAVIQGHVLAMYLPSLISGVLVARIGIRRMILGGALLEVACVALALQGQGVVHYAAAMIALGVGWNLLFVAGTTLLTYAYRPAERFKVQALNEFLMFGVMASASLLAGVLVSAFGWRVLNILALLPLLLLIASLGLLRIRP